MAPCLLTSSSLLCRHHYRAGVPHEGAEGGPLCVPCISTEGSLGPRQLPPLLQALLPCTLYVRLPCGQVCRPGAQGRPQGHDQNVCGTALCCILCCGPATPPPHPGHASAPLLESLPWPSVLSSSATLSSGFSPTLRISLLLVPCPLLPCTPPLLFMSAWKLVLCCPGLCLQLLAALLPDIRKSSLALFAAVS